MHEPLVRIPDLDDAWASSHGHGPHLGTADGARAPRSSSARLIAAGLTPSLVLEALAHGQVARPARRARRAAEGMAATP